MTSAPRFRMIVAACAVVAAATLSACAAFDAADTPATSAPAQSDVLVTQGRHLAEVHCSTCHAIGREGDSRHPMAPPFRQLSRNYPVNQLEEAFAEGVLVGHPAMPEFRLEPAQIDALLSYIQSIQDRNAG